MTRTLIDALRDVPDRRGRKGRQIALPAILSLSVAAIRKTGMSTPAARETFAADRSVTLQDVTGRIL